jgi:hypothetical protein
MTRQMTTYELSPSITDWARYSKNELSAIYKNAATAKGVKFMAWNNDTQRFSIDSAQIPLAQESSGATGIGLKFLSTVDYNTNSLPSSTSTTIPTTRPTVIQDIKVNYNPSDYTEYPVKSGEYAYMISQKYGNSPTKWTEIIRKNTSSFLNSTSASQLKAGEILLIPKSWNAPSIVPTNDPTKKSDDDLLFFGAMGYGLWKFFL